ncbi:MAG: zinc-binding dehydrogenase [Candidatus Latescibacteria bacterium]|nr:zinc-binding dehydrogenase [Candidatus Latescibacterota bacterium]
MDATAIICDEGQNFSLENVTVPDPGPDQIAVRTGWSGVSIGTEFALIQNKISWGPYPICTGYRGTGTVVSVGNDIGNFSVGDQVYYRGNDQINATDGSPITCASGTHCSHVVLKPNTDHGAAILPEGAPADAAAMFVTPAVGLAGVNMAGPKMGSVVVVYGVGLIGLGVVAACAHRGCEVVAVDLYPVRLEIAAKLGADHLIDGGKQDVEAEVKKIAPDGADTVFESTGLSRCIRPAMELCGSYGSFVWQGNYGEATFPFDFMPAHHRRLTMYFPCDDGMSPCRRAVIKGMTDGTLPWGNTITHRITAPEAPALFDRINRGDASDVVGVTINWAD